MEDIVFKRVLENVCPICKTNIDNAKDVKFELYKGGKVKMCQHHKVRKNDK